VNYLKKRRLKGFVIPLFSGVIVSCMLFTIYLVNEINIKQDYFPEDFNYISSNIVSNIVPVLSYDNVVIRPYQAENVQEVKKFYDEENKENGIILYKDTYIQNSGILYSSSTEYNVVSILDGEVINTKKDDILGYVVEVKHTNNLISVYEGLKNLYVKKGDQIKQNTIIGKSGDITLDEKVNNSLLFELIKDGKYVNPDKYFDRKLNEV